MSIWREKHRTRNIDLFIRISKELHAWNEITNKLKQHSKVRLWFIVIMVVSGGGTQPKLKPNSWDQIYIVGSFIAHSNFISCLKNHYVYTGHVGDKHSKYFDSLFNCNLMIKTVLFSYRTRVICKNYNFSYSNL